jgi:hypothetical protein
MHIYHLHIYHTYISFTLNSLDDMYYEEATFTNSDYATSEFDFAAYFGASIELLGDEVLVGASGMDYKGNW